VNIPTTAEIEAQFERHWNETIQDILPEVKAACLAAYIFGATEAIRLIVDIAEETIND
jgi:hypothetical protein